VFVRNDSNCFVSFVVQSPIQMLLHSLNRMYINLSKIESSWFSNRFYLIVVTIAFSYFLSPTCILTDKFLMLSIKQSINIKKSLSDKKSSKSLKISLTCFGKAVLRMFYYSLFCNLGKPVASSICNFGMSFILILLCCD